MFNLSKDLQRKRVQKHREILAITDGVLPSSEASYEAIFDTFHTPYPKTAGDYLEPDGDPINVWATEESSSNQALNPFSKLPLEVFELIFTKLSASALDAARFTCRALHKRIMTSSHILEATVDMDKSSKRNWSTNNQLRELGRQLDEDADLVRHPVEPNGWRVRYRHCGVDLFCPPSHVTSLEETSNLPAQVVNARFCIDGTSIAALVSKRQGQHWTSKIFLYQFCISGRPRYVGSVPLHHSEDPISIRSAAIPDRSEAWSISIGVGQKMSQYRVESSKAFSIHQPAFTIRPETSPLKAEKNPTTPESDDKSWVLLGRLPKSGVSPQQQHLKMWCCTNATQDPQAEATEGSPHGAELFHLAHHIETNQLYTVCVRRSSSFAETLRSSSASPRIKTLVPIAKLLSPHHHAIYRNIAIAPHPAVDGTIQVAIIWQIPTPLGQHASELYIHEIPALHHDFTTEIPAKRIRSLGIGVGGIHPSSLLLTTPEPTSTESPFDPVSQNALSGLTFLQIAQNDSRQRHILKERIFIYAWGPSPQCKSSIKLHIFDISYSTPFLNTLPPHLAPGSKFARKLDKDDNAWGIVCQCALHDDGYRVVLPNLYPSHSGRNAKSESDAKVKAEAENAPTSRWLRIFSRKQNLEGRDEERGEEEEEDLGSVEWRIEEPVQAALNRKEEWLLDKVRVLKRAGLDDEGIITAWFSRRWTRYGFVALPLGWKDLSF